jgi:hypothetical protein
MVALLKYGVGVPFHRLERLQADVQIPLPASTQWEMVAETAAVLQPVLHELIRQAAQGDVIHNDERSPRDAPGSLRPGSSPRATASASRSSSRGIGTRGRISRAS